MELLWHMKLMIYVIENEKLYLTQHIGQPNVYVRYSFMNDIQQ